MAEADRRKWDARYRERGAGVREPSGFLEALDDLLPRRGRARRRRRHRPARALAGEAGAGCHPGRHLGGRAGGRPGGSRPGGAHGAHVEVDLEAEPLPPGPWDLVLCVNFLWRPLFDAIPAALAPGGLLVVAHPTLANLERHARPGPEHLLGAGELPDLVRGLEILRYDEGWREEGRHEARLAARRRDTGAG